MNTPNLKIDSIRINYIYSYFVLAEINNTSPSDQIAGNVMLKWGQKIKDQELYKLYKDEISSNNIYANFDYHFSEELEPLNIRSAIYFYFPHFSVTKAKSEIKAIYVHPTSGEITIPGTMQTHLALFESGMGVMWISLEFTNGITNDQLYFLNQRSSVPRIIIVGDEKAKENPLHNLFSDDIRQLIVQFNAVNSKHSTGFEYKWDSKFWCDEENEYKRGDKVYQEPAIAILIKTKDYLQLVKDKDANFLLLVSSILHGVNSDLLDYHHAKEHIGDNCVNLFPTKKFFTSLHGNCLLVFHNEDYENSTPYISKYNIFKEFTYGLFRTYCAVRGTWHVYNLINEQIDSEFERLNVSH